MPSFNKGPNPEHYTPFGKNVFLRSTRDVKTESFTVAASSIPEIEIDGHKQKILQPGTVMAKITSAAGTSTADDVGKIGPFNELATDGRQTLANIVGIEETFLPWQLMEHDEQVAVVVEARVYQARCLEYASDGETTPAAVVAPLSNTTAEAMVSKKSLSILFA